MKSTKMFLTTCSLFFLAFSGSSFAKDEASVLQGRGLDGKACQVRIVEDGEILKSVELKGASKVFEILSENEDGYGPETRVNANGGAEVLSLLQENPVLYREMDLSRSMFSDAVTYSLDSSDLPPTDEAAIKGIKFKVKIKLDYKNGKLSKVNAEFKAKALLVTLASSAFECSK
ncbi:MAG: hypothetical protein NDI69_13050 [Bacteriovoracaceae bacterium]|nr:hypothetical protein [Bacteriovoracaceae bacterium]